MMKPPHAVMVRMNFTQLFVLYSPMDITMQSWKGRPSVRPISNIQKSVMPKTTVES